MIKLSSLLWSAAVLTVGNWIIGFVCGFWKVPLIIMVFYILLIVTALILDALLKVSFKDHEKEEQ